MPRAPCSFVHDLAFDDLPSDVVDQARRCLLDLVGVAVVGSRTALSRIIRDHAADNLSGRRRTARLWLDGRSASPAGAALANASTIDSMDGHDGHRLAKGHAGAAVLPSAVAVLETVPDTTMRDLVTSMVVGYEIAIRAGIELHATASDYHGSGAWNAVGAAAVAARALGLDRAGTEHALGIAEYHGPRAPMMRCITSPTMIKDSSGWGAHAGVCAALLAADGFTGAPAALLVSSVWHDLGRRWMVLEQYFKRYSVCRWAHPAIDATIELVGQHAIASEQIRFIEVNTFAAATELAVRVPGTTEQAQYSLPFPVAVAAVHRAVPTQVIAHPERAGDEVRRLAESMQVRESQEMTAAFPARRRSVVTLVLVDGRRLSTEPTTASGDPEHRLGDDVLVAKLRDGARPVLGADRTERLVGLLLAAGDHPLAELLGELTPPARPAGAGGRG